MAVIVKPQSDQVGERQRLISRIALQILQQGAGMFERLFRSGCCAIKRFRQPTSKRTRLWCHVRLDRLLIFVHGSRR